LEASQQAEKVNSLLEARDMVVRAATVNMLSNIAEEEDVPDDLRLKLASILPLISFS
jgi:uncharacterized protein (UPF0147 family)